MSTFQNIGYNLSTTSRYIPVMLHTLDEIQDILATTSSIPLLGPALVSPLKAVFSIAQIVTAVTLTIFSLGIGLCVAPFTQDGAKEFLTKNLPNGLLLLTESIWQLAYTILHVGTLGILGLACGHLSLYHCIKPIQPSLRSMF
jgi:hypothetical protein